MRGAVLEQLVALCERHGPDQVHEAAQRCPAVAPHQVKGLIEDLAVEAAAGPDDEGEHSALEVVPPDPVTRIERRRSLAQLVATYEAEGAEVPEDLLSELQACQNGSTPGGTHQ